MKKPLLATLGVVGACAACCAIPVVLPLLGGSALAAALAAWGLDVGWPWTATLSALALTGLALGARQLWRVRQSRCTEAAPPASTACALPRGGCGCGPQSAP